jgi:anthranilate phosphoribosyltransferase
MKHVAPIRKALAVKTFFNMLGPMVNPAFPKNQMVGVFNLELARMYGYLYQNTDKKFTVLHALDGYDEISLTGPTKTISNNSESILHPSDFGVSQVRPEEIAGGSTVAESAQTFLNILQGKGSEAQNHVVCANAGVAISTVQQIEPKQGFEKAMDSLKSGRALEALKKLQQLSA